ncbi:MAG: hypothetical protein GTO46_13245 [Gemmatimonadetes bacterium]|nr:hypothetical protein [Gemmatimonadota bacterium]NIO32549.1 hypothetical protein [Gemmatimonadota bacterium]
MSRHRSAVLLVLLLCSGLTSIEVSARQTDNAAGQEPTGQGEVRGVQLEPNYPNPFSQETRIPFILGADLFEDGRPVVVTIRIYNLLRQPIAIPTALDHPTSAGQPLQELRYEVPGRYEAHWDGTDQSGRRVSSGVYFCEILANRARAVSRIAVTR